MITDALRTNIVVPASRGSASETLSNQAAFFTSSRTFNPARAAIFTSASRLNRLILPFSSALNRGAVKPTSFAASACVTPLPVANAESHRLASALTLRFHRLYTYHVRIW